jgi:hydrogenase nickel incorporation protein HypA/HybF
VRCENIGRKQDNTVEPPFSPLHTTPGTHLNPNRVYWKSLSLPPWEAAVHEVGIASSILECVAGEMQRHPGSRVLSVGVRIGALSSVDKDALDFAFEALTRDTNLEDLKLEIEWVPWRQKCLSCAEEYDVRNMDVTCPKCAATHSTCIAGTELDVAYLELEEEPCVKP